MIPRPADPGERPVDGPGPSPLPAAASLLAAISLSATTFRAEAIKRGATMNFPQAVATCFKKYAVFSGRASRSEYWYFALFYFLGNIAAGILDAVVMRNPNIQIFSSIFDLALVLPFLAVEIRRLHDVDRSGWWVLISLTIIGMIFPLLVWKCRQGTAGPNRFGDDPFGLGWVVSQFE
jgi:uncharacterized membrane protein YhaH (DUF805 family)